MSSSVKESLQDLVKFILSGNDSTDEKDLFLAELVLFGGLSTEEKNVILVEIIKHEDILERCDWDEIASLFGGGINADECW